MKYPVFTPKPKFHIIKSQQKEFKNPKKLLQIFELAFKIEQMLSTQDGQDQLKELLKGIRATILFSEPSTRTRVSFELACSLLGMTVIVTENGANISSAVKKESLVDTTRIICGYGISVIIIRHKKNDAADIVRRISESEYDGRTSVINAGNGTGQHPTQAILDVYTIWKKFGRDKKIKVVLGGDLPHGRTVHSLVYLLARFLKVEFVFVSHELFKINPGIKKFLNKHKIPFTETCDMDVLRLADVIYWTRIQTERLGKKFTAEQIDEICREFTIMKKHMGTLKKGAILMHPLPNTGEISYDIKRTTRGVAFYEQAENGLPVRMALLLSIFGRGV